MKEIAREEAFDVEAPRGAEGRVHGAGMIST